MIVELYNSRPEPDYLTVCRILVFLDNAQETAATLVRLLNGSEVCLKQKISSHTDINILFFIG